MSGCHIVQPPCLKDDCWKGLPLLSAHSCCSPPCQSSKSTLKILLELEHLVCAFEEALNKICGGRACSCRRTVRPKTGCPGQCPDGFWLTPVMETQKRPWTTCVSAQATITVFPDVQEECPPCFSLCPLPLVLSLGISGKSLALPSLYSLFRYLYTLIN